MLANYGDLDGCLLLHLFTTAVAFKVSEWKDRMSGVGGGEICQDGEQTTEENLYPAEEVWCGSWLILVTSSDHEFPGCRLMCGG